MRVFGGVSRTSFSCVCHGLNGDVLSAANECASKASCNVLVGVWILLCFTVVAMLICPGHLQANRPSIGSASSYQHVFFKMDVPKAQNVAVVVGSEWTQLDQIELGSWHGEVVCHPIFIL